MTGTGRALLGAAAGAALAAGYAIPARAGMPVIDTAAVGQLAHQLANDVKAYGLQLQQYAGEVKSWATQNLQWLQKVQQYTAAIKGFGERGVVQDGQQVALLWGRGRRCPARSAGASRPRCISTRSAS